MSFLKTDLKRFFISPKQTISEVMQCIDRNAKGIALVVDNHRHLIGTITDGDIRRAILKGTDLNTPAKTLLQERESTPYPKTVTARIGTPVSQLIQLMSKYSLRHIPLLDQEGCVVDLALLSELIKQKEPPITAVVMAGGYGTRLYPLTKKIPKPMLPLGREPILGLILKQLQKAGISDVHISTYYKSEKITRHFGKGESYGVNLRYIKEGNPLGTAGAIGLMEASPKTLLVINGDILTRMNFKRMLEFHRDQKADMTVAVQKYDIQISYGVVETQGVFIKKLTEKPEFLYLVNAGIYLLEPSVQGFIPNNGRRFDMTDLIQKLIEKGKRVVSFPIREYWLDIGNHQEYNQAKQDVKKGKLKV